MMIVMKKMRSCWTTEAHNRHYIEGGEKIGMHFQGKNKLRHLN